MYPHIQIPPKSYGMGVIWHKFKSKLVILDTSITNDIYVNQILYASGVFKYVNEAFKGKFVFQQDNAKPHVSKQTRKFLEEKGVKYLDSWPPYSTDHILR